MPWSVRRHGVVAWFDIHIGFFLFLFCHVATLRMVKGASEYHRIRCINLRNRQAYADARRSVCLNRAGQYQAG